MPLYIYSSRIKLTWAFAELDRRKNTRLQDIELGKANVLTGLRYTLKGLHGPSIKYAVNWGNSHLEEAKAMGKAANTSPPYPRKPSNYVRNRWPVRPEPLHHGTMPPPYDPALLHALLSEKENSMKQVDEWEKKFNENQR
ncbi:hypothetical protein F3Y22_tig00000916pilonHSYRG00285 [Hibiscus syriacus]|uniref:Uncharacterized protein n=1 Tax=Hibiscus syriacus TaxID=106335 RepID=A0A6A3CX27_HIBSY|nr:hypothetical protein F3Y22_tig00000916pilonHSYRG00285 [Hibiscus syriacus]